MAIAGINQSNICCPASENANIVGICPKRTFAVSKCGPTITQKQTTLSDRRPANRLPGILEKYAATSTDLVDSARCASPR